MGMNYIWIPIVPFSWSMVNVRHLGVSTEGWCFGLHVYPDEGINDLTDWMVLLLCPGSGVFDEDGHIVPLDVVLRVIRDRQSPHTTNKLISGFFREHAEHGPNGLLRVKIRAGYCVGHGEGTWDYLIGDDPF